jgi:hypothetical protein
MNKLERLPLPPTPALLEHVIQTELLAPLAEGTRTTKEGLSKEAKLRAKFLERCRAAHLPIPETEYRFHPVRKWRLDFAWPKYKVALESDGGTFVRGRHTTGPGHAADIEKRNDATLRRWMVLNVVSSKLNSDETIQMIRRALDVALSP